MTDSSEDFASLFGQYEKERLGQRRREPKTGDKVEGKVVAIQGENVFVDLGFKTEGMIDIEEITDQDGSLTLNLGDSIKTVVSGKDAQSGRLLLGSRHARRLHGDAGLRQAFEEQQPVEGHVIGETKGGLEVEMAGAHAFCPASQIDTNYVEDLGQFVGQRLPFRITKFEAGRRTNLVVSRRVLLEEEQRARATETRAQLEVGAVMKGRVSSLKRFGAFIDLGGIEGLVHISELAFGRVKDPSDLLSVGQPVEVSVLRIEQTDNPKQPEKISLSIRALEQDPWQDVTERFPVGSLATGTVSRIQPFGAFIELAPGVDGLAHISELGAGRRVNHPQELLSVGDRVEATVLGVDPEKRRISLSLDTERQAGQDTRAQDTTGYGKPKQGFGTLGDLLKETLDKKKRGD